MTFVNLQHDLACRLFGCRRFVVWMHHWNLRISIRAQTWDTACLQRTWEETSNHSIWCLHRIDCRIIWSLTASLDPNRSQCLKHVNLFGCSGIPCWFGIHLWVVLRFLASTGHVSDNEVSFRSSSLDIPLWSLPLEGFVFEKNLSALSINSWFWIKCFDLDGLLFSCLL